MYGSWRQSAMRGSRASALASVMAERLLLPGALVWLALVGSGFATARPSTPRSRTPEAALRGEFPDCGLRQARRLYVGFAQHMSLDDIAAAAAQSRHLVPDVRRQVCASAASASSAVLRLQSSLRAALASRQRVDVSEVIFSDAAFSDARVELRELLTPTAPVVLAALGPLTGSTDRPSGRWHVRVMRQDDVWQAYDVSSR
jgi:hypothetical protein